MNFLSNDFSGDCVSIHSDGYKSDNVEENISTFHNGDSVQNGDFLPSPEELDPKTMDFEKLVQLMHPEFVSDYLTRILNFLKSEENIISFPNIAPFKAAFLKKLVRNLEYKGFNDACKSIASEIIDILEANKCVYKWIYAYDHGRFAKNVPAYKKIFYKKSSPNVQKHKTACINAPNSCVSESPKSSMSSVEELKITKTDISYLNQKKNSTEDILNTTASTDISERSDVKSKRKSRKQRKRMNRQKFIQGLQPDFMQTSLNSILSLVEDETMETLIISDVTENEAKFYRSISTLKISKETSDFLPKTCKSTFTQLKQYLKKSTKCWEIRVVEDIVDGNNKLRDVTLTKVPIGERLTPDNQSTSEPTESVISKESDSNRSTESTLSRDRSMSNDRRSQRSRYGIQFECGGRLDPTEGGNSNGDPGGERRAPTKELELTSRNTRLLEAMSVPLECDKAMRMMRLMGWQGGALGARGEGITEPIMPTLNIITGAGLGHNVQVKQKQDKSGHSVRVKQKQDNRIPVEYRIELLEIILAFLRSDATERGVEYAPPLCHKEERFINASLRAFNHGNKLGLNDHVERGLVKKISQEMQRDPRLTLKKVITGDGRFLTLRKSTDMSVLPQAKRNQTVTSKENNRVQVFEQPDPSIRSELLTLEDVLSILGEMELPYGVSTKKSRESLAYRIFFLVKILDFLKNGDEQHEYRLDRVLSCKRRNYIKNIITSINRKGRIVASSDIEMDFLIEIKAKLNGCYLDVTFSSGYQKFILQKMFYNKRAINILSTQIADDNSSAANNNSSVASDNINSIVDRNDTDNDTTVIDDDVQVVTVSSSDISIYDTPKSEQTEVAPIKKCEIREEVINNEIKYEKNQSKDVDLSNVAILNSEKCVFTKETDISLSVSDVLESDINRLEETGLRINLDVQKDINFNIELENNNYKIHNDNGSVQNKELRNQKNNDLKEGDKSISDIVNTTLNDKQDLLMLDLKDGSDLNPSSTKRSRSVSGSSDKQIKKSKFNFSNIKKVGLVLQNNENEKMTVETVKRIQTLLLNTIDDLYFLPLLECHGIQNDVLIYSCYNKKTLNWLESTVVASDENLKIIPFHNELNEQTETHTVAIKINSSVTDSSDKFFERIEIYNPCLDTKRWIVMDILTYDYFFVIIANIDMESLKFITESNFSLFIGLDKAKFSII